MQLHHATISVYCGDIVLLPVGAYSSNHRVLYTIGISMTRRFQKSVGSSVRPSVCNANKKAYSSIIMGVVGCIFIHLFVYLLE